VAATRLGLYELLSPQLLLGFTFPEHIDRYLSILGVDELRTTSDETGVVYSGRASFSGEAGAAPVRQHWDPSGAVFEWDDVTIDFRLTLPRDGAAVIDSTLNSSVPPQPVRDAMEPLADLFDTFGPVEQTAGVATDYPGLRFRLELLVSALTFHLGPSWLPGEVGADHRISRMDPALPATPKDVRFVLPKVVLEYEQGDDLSTSPAFRVRSWGSSGFEAPADLEAGELVRMEPEIALHESGRIAFGVGAIVLDLSADHTPPEILSFFGVDEAFEGIYVKSVQFYYADSDKSLGFNFGVRDALISFAGEVSLEARLDILGPETEMDFEVRLYEGDRRVEYSRGRPVAGGSPRAIRGSTARLRADGVIHVLVRGGAPPHTVSVRLNGTEIWNTTDRVARIPSGTTGTRTLSVDVTDADAASPRAFDEEIELTIVPAAGVVPPAGLPADRLPAVGDLPAAVFTQTTPGPAGYSLSHTPGGGGISETITVLGPPGATVAIGSQPARPVVGGRVVLDVPEGSDAAPIPIAVAWPAAGGATSETFRLEFELDRPDPVATGGAWTQIRAAYVADTESPHDEPFSSSRAPNDGAGAGVAGLRDWAATRVLAGTAIQIEGHASYERDENASRDLALSQRRMEIARAIIEPVVSGTITTAAQGHTAARSATPRRVGSAQDRVALITGQVTQPQPAVPLDATISRAARPAPPAVPTTPPAAAPPPAPNEPPSTFRRLSFRVRLERNVPVLLEVSGELDFETEMEAQMRAATPATATAPSGASGDLALSQTSAASANPNPADGIVDFTLAVTYDTATHVLTERLALGAAPGDIDGLLRMENPRGASATADNRLRDAFGALLVLAPVTNAAAAALDTDSAGDWALLGVSVAVPATIGALGVFRTETVTLYGGELRFRQFVPPAEAATFTDAGVVFDYGVEFGIHIEQLGISTTKPLKVRYRAIGFNLNFQGGVTYQPIFDTSKGYEIDLSDPGLFNLPSPLGDVIKILAVRLARTNPLTLEADLGLKVDLGVVTVDRFRVKWPLDPLGVPSILPTGAKIDIPGAIVGTGFVNITEPPGPGAPADAISAAGFEGMLDVSIVPMKVRIAASLGVRHLKDPAQNREAIAIFAGLIVDFPTPIPILQSGIGIYGFAGLFAMHYKRLEDAPVAGDSVSPALHWLVKAGGEPAKLASGSPLVPVWGPEFDRWSFGLGAKLGTMEGGFLVNLRGMLVVELPGPRILIFVKIEIVAVLKGLQPATELRTGILGVVDLDFNLWQLTVGVLIDMEIEHILRVQIPVELWFKLQAPWPWHLHIGTFQSKATAEVLNLVRAYGYFQISGHDIVGWPGYDTTRTLTPIAVATGVAASILLGDEGIGLYLRVSAKADLGVSFFPGKMYMIGRIRLDGELRLFIISIEAHGALDVEAPDPTYIDGEICGRVSFFFFSVSGCVGLTIGSNVRSLPAPDLVLNTFLQSHAPVLTAGQADRPIDASLGDALRLATGAPIPSDSTVPVVPIDTVPVLQLHASPLVSGATTFTETLVPSPRQTVGGWIEVGGGRKVKYVLKELSLDPPLAASAGLPPATWRTETDPAAVSGAKVNIDLALMSRVPVQGERAMERSSELTQSVTLRWQHACEPVAPAVCVLWTFCREPIGPSGEGWELRGLPEPDPPGTTRTTPPPTDLYVEEPAPETVDLLAGSLAGPAGADAAVPAKVIGPGSGRPGDPQWDPREPDEREEPEEPREPGEPPIELVCVRHGRLDPGSYANPRRDEGMILEVHDFAGNRFGATRIVQWGGYRGLDVGFRTVVALPAGSRAVELTLVHFSRPARVRAFNADGSSSSASMSGPQATPETLRLTGKSIIRLVIDAPQDETLLLALCAEPQPKDRRPPVPGLLRPTGDPRRDRLAREVGTTLHELALEEFEAAERTAVEERRGEAATGTRAMVRSAGIGRFERSAKLDAECLRALQLPASVRRPQVRGFEVGEKAADYLKNRPESSWVTFHTGRARNVRMLIAVAAKVPGTSGVIVRQLAAGGSLVREDQLAALDIAPVSGVTGGLPGEWLDPAGPWRASVLPVATFLSDQEFAHLERWVLSLEPESRTERIQIAVPPTGRTRSVPEVLVGVVEVCPVAETERVETEEQIRDGQIETLTGYLDGDTPVPLLKPATTYRLRVRYDAVTQPADGPETTEADKVQEFGFRTDARAPRRLDPWVLGTTPNDLERFAFWRDPLKIVFNDLAIVQLFMEYGKNLRVLLRAADGVPIPHQEISALDPVDADFWSPYRDVVEGLIGSGLLSCAGEVTFPHHGAWTSSIELRPLMGYTLDVVVDPAYPAPTGADADKPILPLYRRSFSTSRFADLGALVDDLKGRRIGHRVLNAQLSGLPAGSVATATDEQIQAALVAAGEQALPAPEENGVVIYWAQRSGATTYSPHAILVDAAEPLWRTRQEPRLETVPGQTDPAYKRVVPGEATALRMTEQGSAGIARFVRSPSGTRTLAIVKDSFVLGSGATIRLALEQPSSTLYALSATTVTLAELVFGPVAPWEEDG
jgi:hypothetical protein